MSSTMGWWGCGCRARSIRVAVVAVALLGMSYVEAQGDFNYADFSSIAGLTLNGDAAQAGSVLRVAANAEDQSGSAWYTATKQHVADGFDTTFTFQLSGGSGADGFAFLIQDDDTTSLGNGGSGLGYEGIPRSLAIEFDTFGFSPESDNHVSVQSLGNNGNSVEDADSLGLIEAPFDLNDGETHTAVIRYRPGVLLVYLDGSPSPILTVSVDLQDINGDDILDGAGDAWVGFTAATGGASQDHDILDWTFDETSDPLPTDACDCENASTLFENTFIPDSTVGSQACDGSPCSGTSPARIYSYTPTQSGWTLINTCDGSDFDTVISVHSGCPMTTENQVACDLNSCGTDAQVYFCSIAGQTYYVRVGGEDGASGDYMLLTILLAGDIYEGPFQNPGNGHWYYHTNPAPWTGLEPLAISKGGHLATVNDGAENDWLRDTFTVNDNGMAIGLNDAAVEGTFVWASGEPVTYTNWQSGQPDNAGDEDYALLNSAGEWEDHTDCNAGAYRGVIEVDTVQLPGVIAGPIRNPGNCHDYYITESGTWIEQQLKAESLGGNLVTIDDSAENEWVRANFANYNKQQQPIWIGMSDFATENMFEWADGSPVAYTNWASGEPNNLGNEDYVMMSDATTGEWNDAHSGIHLRGVIEIPTEHCPCQCLLGDMNCDDEVTTDDIPEFVKAVLQSGGFGGCDINLADMNGDSQINGRDTQFFVNTLLGN